MLVRFSHPLAALAFAALLSACGGGASMTAPAPTAAPPTAVPTSIATPAGAAGFDVALGDSVSFGLAASTLCVPWPGVPVLIPGYCPGGTSFVQLVAASLATAQQAPEALLDLGMGGAEAPTVYGAELQFVPTNATLVTFAIGINDTRGAAEGAYYRGGNLAAALARSEAAYDAILADLARRAPHAKIVLVDSPNQAYIAMQPQGVVPPSLLRLYDRSSQTFVRFVLAHAGAYAIADVTCEPRFYQAAYTNGVHPNDAGHAVLAAKVEAAIAATPGPVGTVCPPYLTSSIP